MLSQVSELLQSLADQTYIDAVEIPQVRLERRQDWSMKGAVDLQLLRVQRNAQVCTAVLQMLDIRNRVSNHLRSMFIT